MLSSPSDSQIVAAYQADLATAFVISSITTLAAYEYVITIEREVVMVWWRKWTLATWIFIVNRYLMITVVIMEIAPASAKSCSGGLVALDVLPVAQYCVFAVFSTLRVFSIWNRNIPMSLLVLLLNLVPVITSIYKFTQESDMFAVDPIFGTFCGSILNIPIATNLDIALGTRLAVITADAIVLAVTWKKTYKNRKDGLRLGMEIPLTSLLLRDGTMYFVAHLAMNVAQVLINSVPSLQNISPVGEIIDVLIPILISRFLLNLRQIGEPQNNTVDVSQSRFSAPMFRAPTLASIIGNMGQELEHGSIGEVKVGSAVGERVIEPKEDTSMLDEGVQCDPQVDCLVVKDTITMNEIRESPLLTI